MSRKAKHKAEEEREPVPLTPEEQNYVKEWTAHPMRKPRVAKVSVNFAVGASGPELERARELCERITNQVPADGKAKTRYGSCLHHGRGGTICRPERSKDRGPEGGRGAVREDEQEQGHPKRGTSASMDRRNITREARGGCGGNRFNEGPAGKAAGPVRTPNRPGPCRHPRGRI